MDSLVGTASFFQPVVPIRGIFNIAKNSNHRELPLIPLWLEEEKEIDYVEPNY
jgi:hypothetical protein